MTDQFKIVCLGAGTGQAALLKGLKDFPLKLSAIVSVTDNGGHSGKLRNLFNTPQVGDGRQCLLSLAADLAMVKRFDVLPTGFNPGNWFLTELLLEGYSLADAFGVLGSLLNSKGEVLPSTEADANIVARFETGEALSGEWEIIELNRSAAIAELFLAPRREKSLVSRIFPEKIQASPRVVLAVQEADWLIIGPGSLRTGIIAALLPTGIKEAIQSSAAPILYICNLMTQPGQTDGFTVADHVKEVARYLGRQPGYVIINNLIPPKPVLKHYRLINSHSVLDGDLEALNIKVIKTDLLPSEEEINLAVKERVGSFKKWTHLLTHDGEKMAKVIKEIIEF